MSHLLRAANGRTIESVPGRTTRHSFSFGATYDPNNVMFGPLVCHNDDLLDPGIGYPEHAHSDVEIVTWVLSGCLVHRDSMGNHSELRPGTVQVQSAGAGIRHSEMADSVSGPTRFIQTWIRPDTWDLSPTRHLAQVTAEASELVTAVGGPGLPIASAGTKLSVGTVPARWRGTLPQARGVHVFVASGEAEIETGEGTLSLSSGDALRLLDEPGAAITTLSETELLVWSFT